MSWPQFKTRRNAEASSSTLFHSTLVEDRQLSRFDPMPGMLQADGDYNHLALASGEIGRYQLRTVLGEGGLGRVYGAWDPLLSRRVAVKTLQATATPAPGATPAADSTANEQILNEARAAARLTHPHIVTVYDAGNSDQGVYIAMEPLQGLDLRQMLRQGWRPGFVEAGSLVRRVAEALAYAHGKGVIHCDIKPANIFMVDRRQPKVLDFGIARMARRDESAQVSASAGSPHYLSPEQLQHGLVDRRCDVYSLGVVLFELLTGRPPYNGHTVAELNAAVLNAPQPIARQIEPSVPPTLSAIAERAMARSPDDRYPSARHLAMALRDWKDSDEAHKYAVRSRSQLRFSQPWVGGLLLALLALSSSALVWSLMR